MRSSPSRLVTRFLHAEAAGGVVLLVAAAVALVWANSPWDHGYHSVFNHDVQHWVNEGLMTVFFFVVGLEIKRELVAGELREWRTAAVPAVAAVGGMVVPALFYVVVARDRGWGIPMATDIAFAVGLMALLGRRVPGSLKLFLLTLAVVDDIGAILVIALFYSAGVKPLFLLGAAAAVALVFVVRNRPVLALVAGVLVWAALYNSGVHATLAGVVVGLMLPQATVEGLEDRLHPWSAFLVVPLFALANAGVRLDSESIGNAVESPIAIGVVLGLVVGKPVGIALASWAAVRSGLGTLPRGASWPQLIATGAVAGVGFTVSLFVTGLAFPDPAVAATAIVGVLAASALSAVLGIAGLTFWGTKT
ncbi:MAG TPA: Na+/H+ antiporter NhaA [Acidimicrobiales bacterium]|nr:Na+/H+ antiporter NhaA [Acidimicrobiales bacterium]